MHIRRSVCTDKWRQVKNKVLNFKSLQKREGLEISRTVQVRNFAFLALLLWLLLTSAYRAAVNPTGGVTGLDFLIFYRAAAHLNAGQALYHPRGELYAYSPMLAELLRPLALLPYATALKAWFFVNAFCLIMGVLLYARAAQVTWRDPVSLGLILLVGFRFWPTTMNFAIGNSNLALLLVIAAVFWADSRNKIMLAALLIAAAALVKVWMLGLLLYFVFQRQWKAIAVSMGAFVVGMGLLFSFVGWWEWPLFLQASAATAREITGVQPTQSITGFAHLHFQANPFVQPIFNSVLGYRVFVLGCTAFLLGVFISLWRRGAALSMYERRLSLGLVIVSLLLLLPPFEDAYAIYCLPLLWTLLLPGAGERRTSWTFPAGLVIYLVFTRGWPMYTPIALVYQHGWRTLLVSMDFFIVSALWVVAVIVFYQGMRDPSHDKLRIQEIPAVSEYV